MKKGKQIIYGFRYEPQSKRSVKFSQVITSQTPDNNNNIADQKALLRSEVIFLTKQNGEWQRLRDQKQKSERQLFDSRLRVKELQELNFLLTQKIKQKQSKIQLIEQELQNCKWQLQQALRKIVVKEKLINKMSKNSVLNQTSVLSILCELEEQCIKLRQQIHKIQGIQSQSYIPKQRGFQIQNLVNLTHFQFQEANYKIDEEDQNPRQTQENTKYSQNFNTEYSQPAQNLQQKSSLAKLPQRISLNDQHIIAKTQQQSYRSQIKNYSYQRYLIKQNSQKNSKDKKFDDIFD